MANKEMMSKDEMDQCISTKNEVAQESCFVTKTNESNNAFDHFECYPFVETPLMFQFGNHEYGKQLFADAYKEIMYHKRHKASYSSPNKYSADDVYSLSTITDMMKLFVKDNLF
ncbi:hypothetical protein CASFOL_023321 [Castilleja foliolosa]|uniref:Uncharacterized protein n=1 Tax=Castilleja foliolosa TaxID=1961234 RepID=A0ABD3CLJ9_9LAMI